MSSRMIQKGNTIKVDYTMRLEDGAVVGSTVKEEPVEFTVGEGEVIPGLEEAVVGMHVGDSRTLNIPYEEAYGPRMEDLVQDVERGFLPEGFDPQLGQVLEITDEQGDSLTAVVIGVESDKIKLDANHPLAGKNVILDLRIIGIES